MKSKPVTVTKNLIFIKKAEFSEEAEVSSGMRIFRVETKDKHNEIRHCVVFS